MGDHRICREVNMGSVLWTDNRTKVSGMKVKQRSPMPENTGDVEKRLRKQVAAMLDGNMKSRLSACNAWLSMAERLLGDLRFDLSHLSPEMTAQSVLAALSLLHKVRDEVDQLRQTEIGRPVQHVYPTLIQFGLRPALEALTSIPKEKKLHSNEDVAEAATVEWMFGEKFVHWDRPTEDQKVLRAQLDTYRLVEAAVRAAQAASMVYAAPGGFADRPRERTSGLAVRIHVDVNDGELHIRIYVDCGAGGGHCNETLDFVAQSLPRRRFELAGGRLSVLSDLDERLHVKAMLPIA